MRRLAHRWGPAVAVAIGIVLFALVLTWAYHERTVSAHRTAVLAHANAQAITHLCQVQERQQVIASTLALMVTNTIARDRKPSGVVAIDAHKQEDIAAYTPLLPRIKAVIVAINRDGC